MSKLKLSLLAVAIVMVGAFGATTAQASRGITVTQTRITATGVLTLNGGLTVCNVSLTLSLGSTTLTKTRGTNQGSVTAGSITGCSGLASSGAVLTPINVQYDTFAGTLPNITSISIVAPNAGFSLNTLGGTCLYGGSLSGVRFLVTGGAISNVDFTGSNAIAKVSGGALCPSTGTITGPMTVTTTVPRIALV